MKVGTVALIGRPNTGKSTLVNNLVGQKVAITSPLPQTTQFPIFAVYEDPSTALRASRGQIIFVDTPGIFARLPKPPARHALQVNAGGGTGGQAKAGHERAKTINLEAERILKREQINILIYIVDHTRRRGIEENRVFGIVRKVDIPKILVINKIDIEKPSYREQYKFLEEEFDSVIEVSALKNKSLNLLISEIFKYLPEGKKVIERADLPVPALNLNSKLYIEELIREKAFLNLRDELPYNLKVVVDDITEKSLPQDSNEGKNTEEQVITLIKARIITLSRYKKMIIGKGGRMIKEIGMAARKELELATGRKVYIELQVEAE